MENFSITPMAYALGQLYEYIQQEKANTIKQYSAGKMPEYVLEKQNEKINKLNTIADNINKQYNLYTQHISLLRINEKLQKLVSEKIPAHDYKCSERMLNVARQHANFDSTEKLVSALYVAYVSTDDLKQA